MAIYHGTQKIVGLYHGTDKIVKRYKGTQLIFQSRVLPAGFVECEYLESTGTQWIDTGITNFSTVHIISNAMASSDNCESLFGARVGSGNQDIRILFSSQRRISVGLWNMYWGYNEYIPTSDYLGKRKFEINNCAFYCDNTLFYNNATKPSSKETSTFNIYLFAFNNDGVVASQGSWKMYDFKLYDGTTLVRNFIPCLDNTGTPCLYDRVSKTAFYNQGTGEFLYKVKIPNAYQQVEYIESSGTQYIDTGLKIGQYDTANADFSFSVLPNSVINMMGARSTDNNAILHLRINATNQIEAWFGSGLNSNITIAVNTKYQVKCYGINGSQSIYVNGTQKNTSTKNYADSSNASSYIFAMNDNGTPYNRGSFKLYVLKILLSNNIVRYFVPCYHKSDNVIGLYDAVNDKFYTNAGAGTFIKGGDI